MRENKINISATRTNTNNPPKTGIKTLDKLSALIIIKNVTIPKIIYISTSNSSFSNLYINDWSKQTDHIITLKRLKRDINSAKFLKKV